jgi:hypothetical protein
MVDPISNAPRQIGPTQIRSQASSAPAGFEVTRDGLTSVQLVETLQAPVEKLIKENPPKHRRFPLLSDEEANADLDGGSDPQWPPAQLLKLHRYLKQMEGLLLDTEA